MSTMRRTRRTLAIAAAAVVLLGGWFVVDGGGTDSGGTDAAVVVAESVDVPGLTETVGKLDALPVKGRAPKTGYDREEQFGNGWLDPDGNGCDARNDVLARDLRDTTSDDGCTVLSGTLDDPYTGDTMSFTRGQDTSADVQIDHVVSLMNAWETGAQQLSQVEREELANDPANLQATHGPTNQQKSDGDAATWLPPNKAFRCEYVQRQVEVKAEHGLWVTAAEKDAIGGVLDACTDRGNDE